MALAFDSCDYDYGKCDTHVPQCSLVLLSVHSAFQRFKLSSRVNAITLYMSPQRFNRGAEYGEGTPDS